MFSYGVVSVGSTATIIGYGSDYRKSLVLYNNGTATVYVGDASVSTSTGFPVGAGGSIEFGHTKDVYGIVATGTQEVRYFAERG